MVRCPACARECAENTRFCSSCAAPLDATSAETVALGSGVASVPRLSATSSVDEGRFLPGTVIAGRYRVAGLLVVLLVVYGFRVSLGGRKLLKEEL
jgi:hypothetical protein